MIVQRCAENWSGLSRQTETVLTQISSLFEKDAFNRVADITASDYAFLDRVKIIPIKIDLRNGKVGLISGREPECAILVHFDFRIAVKNIRFSGVFHRYKGCSLPGSL